MHDDPIYIDLPEDPGDAFLFLEAGFSKDCEADLDRAGGTYDVDAAHLKYIARILGAIKALALNAEDLNHSLPSLNEADDDYYKNFLGKVEHYKTTLKILSARRRREYSVTLDAVTKTKLRHLLSQMKDVVQKLDVPDQKKEALFAKIAALEAEINRDRTRFEVLAALWLEACDKAAEGFEKLEPLRKWIDPIGGLFSSAKTEENGKTRQLPSSFPPKQLEPPNASSEPPDDNIPF